MKHSSIGCLLALSVATIFTSSTAHATDVALAGDAHVSATLPTTNFGTLANLYVGNGNTALLQFDLSTLPTGVTDSQVARATLTLFVNRVNTGGLVNLAPVTKPWTESGVTYAAMPTIGSTTASFTAANAGVYVTLDVTSLVQKWITTPAGNFSVALTSTAANLLLDSKENDETGHAATLDVTITSMGPQGNPGPVGATGQQGIQGAPGTVGATGQQGIQGPAGPAGTTGATGTIGAVTNWSSSVNYQVGQVVFCAACSTSGSSYVAVATNTNQDPPTQAGFWQLIAIAGATGPQGIQGAQGLQGPIGTTGAQGNAGAQGATGATGTIGVVTNWSSSVTYQAGQVVFCAACSTSGSSYVAVATSTNQDPPTQTGFWQMIAQAGAFGPAGAAGPTGATGAAGAAGAMGATGPQGPQGNPGTNGTNGTGSVTSVTLGTVSNTAAAGAGTISISNTTTTPTISINFPASSGSSTGFTFSGNYINSALGTTFMNPVGFAEQGFSQLAFNAAPATCTVRSLTVNSLTTNVINPIIADTTDFTVFDNDSPTTMTCTITNLTTNNSSSSCVDSTHTFSVSQGDRISLRVVESLTDGNTAPDFQMVAYGTTLVCN